MPVDGKAGAEAKSKTLRGNKGVVPFYYVNFGNNYSKIKKVVIYWGALPSATVTIKYRITDSNGNEGKK